MALEEGRDLVRILEVPLDPQAQGLQTLSDEEGVEGRDRGPQVTQQLHTRLEPEGHVGPERPIRTEVTRVDEPVIALVRGVPAGELLRVCSEVEGPTIDDDPRDRGPMSPKVFRRRVDDDIRPVLQGVQHIRRRDRVVHDERHPGLVRDGRHLLDVEHISLRIGDRLREEGLRVRAHRRPPRLGIVLLLDECHLDAQAREGVLEQVEGSAIERGRRDDVVAGLGDVVQGERCRRLPRGDQQRTDPAFQRGDPVLDRGLRRVHDPGVDVAEFLEREQVCRVLGVPEDETRRLVDRQCARPRRRVRDLARVDLLGLETPGALV